MTKAFPKHVTLEELADLWGLDVSRVRQLSRTGLKLNKLKNGKYSFQTATRSYHSYLKSKADTEFRKMKADLYSSANAEPNSPPIDPLALQRKLTAEATIAEAKAREVERKEKVESSELVYRSAVSKARIRDLKELKSRCFQWLQTCLDSGDFKPMQREQKENEFVEFFNQLAKREWR